MNVRIAANAQTMAPVVVQQKAADMALRRLRGSEVDVEIAAVEAVVEHAEEACHSDVWTACGHMKDIVEDMVLALLVHSIAGGTAAADRTAHCRDSYMDCTAMAEFEDRETVAVDAGVDCNAFSSHYLVAFLAPVAYAARSLPWLLPVPPPNRPRLSGLVGLCAYLQM